MRQSGPSGRLGMNPETLRKWLRQAAVDAGQAEGMTTAAAREIRELKRKNAELEQTVEILKAATSFNTFSESIRDTVDLCVRHRAPGSVRGRFDCRLRLVCGRPTGRGRTLRSGSVCGYASGLQGGADVPHERQRATGEDLNVVGQRDLGQVHEALSGAVVVGLDGLVPGVGGEVVDLPADVQDGVA